LSPFDVGSDLRTNHSQEGGNDENEAMSTMEPIQVPTGPVTRSRAKAFKDALNGLVQEVWAQECSLRPIGANQQVPQSWISLIQAQE